MNGLYDDDDQGKDEIFVFLWEQRKQDSLSPYFVVR